MFKKILMILPVAMMVFTSSPVQAKDEAYDWVMEVETKKLKRQFDYDGSNLHDKIVKTDIYIYPTEQESKSKQERFNSSQTKHYKKMWHFQTKTMGTEQLHEFDVEPNQGFAIKITHKENASTEMENKAAAAAIVKLALELYVRKQHLVSVKVPPDSYHQIAEGLNEKGFHIVPNPDPEHPIPSKMAIFMSSDAEPIQFQDTYHYQ